MKKYIKYIYENEHVIMHTMVSNHKNAYTHRENNDTDIKRNFMLLFVYQFNSL